jgi:hypothetical protein
MYRPEIDQRAARNYSHNILQVAAPYLILRLSATTGFKWKAAIEAAAYQSVQHDGRSAPIP